MVVVKVILIIVWLALCLTIVVPIAYYKITGNDFDEVFDYISDYNE